MRWVAAGSVLLIGGFLGFGPATVRAETGDAWNTEIAKTPTGPAPTAPATPKAVSPPPTPAGSTSAPAVGPVATNAQLAGDDKATEFAMNLSRGVPVEIFTLAEPYRVIIDLPDTSFRLNPGAGQKGLGLVTAYRYGLFAERKARIVLDTKGPVRITRADMSETGDKAVRLTVGLQQTDIQSFGEGTGAGQPSTQPGKPAPLDEPVPTVAKKAGAKPIIVIDPGHGGIDPGAIGQSNMPEKMLVLAVAKELKAALAGRYNVRLTRERDVFIALDNRLKFSRMQNADLFISLHADSLEDKTFQQAIRGATVYTLSDRASDAAAQRMAEKENASDLLAGLQTVEADGSDQVKSILIDLMRRETANFSADLSKMLVGRLGKAITLARDPQRSAAFKVLRQTHAPSVLIELGYMSHVQDEQLMQTPEWQKKVAGSISAAVDQFFTKRTAQGP